MNPLQLRDIKICMSRPIGTPAELERRRRHAVDLLNQGESPTVVARILGVGRPSLYRWQQLANSGPDGLIAKPHPGPTPFLDTERLVQLEDLLLNGATSHGWPNELWTAPRVAEVIRRHFGISFHPEHVRKILKQRLHWSSQRPHKLATQRDEEEILRWLEQEFPRIVRETRQRDAHLVFLDESGFMLTPLVRRTLAPRGLTPPLWCSAKRDRISAISCITLSPRRYLPGLYFELLPDNVNVTAAHVVAFLKELKKSLPAFTVIWDGNNIHSKARLVKAFLAEHPEVVAEDFPGYVPELNPDEGVWGHTKYARLANFAPAHTQELRERVDAELRWLKDYAYHLYSFIDHTKLPLKI
jgi:transposase